MTQILSPARARAERIRTEKLRLLYHGVFAVPTNLVVALVVAFLLRDTFPPVLLAFWLLATAVTAAACAAVLAAALPSSAINSYNATPAPERTEVGALIATWDNDDDPATPDRVDWVCSGTMIDGNTFLTAAHCTTDWPDNVKFYVSLDQDVQAGLDAAAVRYPGDPAAQAAAVGVQGVAHTDPAYPGPASDPHDIAVIDLPAQQLEARWNFTPATLPTADQFGALGPQGLGDTDWFVAGYGTQEAVNGPGGQTHPGGGVPMVMPSVVGMPTQCAIRGGRIELAGISRTSE